MTPLIAPLITQLDAERASCAGSAWPTPADPPVGPAFRRPGAWPETFNKYYADLTSRKKVAVPTTDRKVAKTERRPGPDPPRQHNGP
jgi:hypothetical protein